MEHFRRAQFSTPVSHAVSRRVYNPVFLRSRNTLYQTGIKNYAIAFMIISLVAVTLATMLET